MGTAGSADENVYRVASIITGFVLGFASPLACSGDKFPPPARSSEPNACRLTMVADSRELMRDVSVTYSAAGWSASGLAMDRKRISPAPEQLVIPLSLAQPAPVSLAGFDAIWLDYSTAPGLTACRLDIELRLMLRPLARPRQGPCLVAAATAEPELEVMVSSRPDPHAWGRKNMQYLAARLLGIAADEKWRFGPGNANDLVVQRRWLQDLHGVEAIDIAVDAGASPSHINLVVQARGSIGADLLPFDGIPADSRLADGRPGVRLHVRAALEKRVSRESSGRARGCDTSLVLKEMVVFFPKSRSPLFQNPVAEVSFLGSGQRDAIEFAPLMHLLPKQAQTVALGHERAMVPLDPLARGNDALLLHSFLVIRPPTSQQACAVRVAGASLVNTYARQKCTRATTR